MGKNLKNYGTIRNETNIYELKPVSIDEFSDVEETEVRARVEKKKRET